MSKVAINSLYLYKDCLRAARNMAGKTAKAEVIIDNIRGQFKKNKNVTDPDKIEDLKGDALRSIANYVTMANSLKDQRIQSHQEKIFKSGQMYGEIKKLEDPEYAESFLAEMKEFYESKETGLDGVLRKPEMVDDKSK